MPIISRPDLVAAAFASLAGAGMALLVQIVQPSDHGSWLVAYLVLVGFLAQLLLAVGQGRLRSAQALGPPPGQPRLAQLLLWNLGVIAVPVGVLADTRLVVVAGTISLLTALESFRETAAAALPGSRGPTRPMGWGYALLLLGMTVSTLVGTALAWDIPWA
jgi:hypothetical protein